MSKFVLSCLVFALVFCSLVHADTMGDTSVLAAKNMAKSIRSTLSKAKSSYRKAQDKIPRTRAQKSNFKTKIVKGEVSASRLKTLIKQGRTLKPQDVLSKFRKTRTLNVRVSVTGEKFFQLKNKWYRVIHAGKWSNFAPNDVYSVCTVGPTAYSEKYTFKYNRKLSTVLKTNSRAALWADLGLDVNVKYSGGKKKAGKKSSGKKSSGKKSSKKTGKKSSGKKSGKKSSGKKSSKKTGKKSSGKKSGKKSSKKVPKNSVKYGKCYTVKQYNKLVKTIKSRYGAKAPENKPESLVVADVPFTKAEVKRKKRCAIRKAKQIKRRKCLKQKKQKKQQSKCQQQPACGCGCAAPAPVAAAAPAKCARRGANLRFKGRTTLNVKKLVIKK